MKKIVLFCTLFFAAQLTFSQYFKDNKDVIKYQGYFDFYYDASKDKIYLEIDKIDSEFLYVYSLSEGI